MAQPTRKTEYRLITLSEIREEANRRLYQANKMRAEYEARARQKADQAAAWGRATGARIETDARRLQQQVQTGARQVVQGGQAKAQAIGQVVERGVGQVQRGMRQGASRVVQEGQRLHRDVAGAAQRGAAVARSHIDDLQRRGAKTLDDAAAFSDHAREVLKDRAGAIRDRAVDAMDKARDYGSAAAEVTEKAPYAIGQGIHDWWLNDIRDDQKYFWQLNDYERAHLFDQYGIADWNSAEAHAVEAYILGLRRERFDREKAAFDSLPPSEQFAKSVVLGLEQGGLKGSGAIGRAIAGDQTRSFDDRYFTERLPHTFAREEHPVAYFLSDIGGAVASDAALFAIDPGLPFAAELGGAFAEGYVSEPGDIKTRAFNGAINVAGDQLAQGLAKPVQKYAGKELRKLIGIAPALEPTFPARRIAVKASPDEAAFKGAGKVGDPVVEESFSAGVDEGIDRAKDWREAQIERNRKSRASPPVQGAFPARR